MPTQTKTKKKRKPRHKKSKAMLQSENKQHSTIFPRLDTRPYYANQARNIELYLGDCLEILQQIPENSVDMIFADPPYFLSNGGFTCHAGRMVSVDKGKWDVSRGPELNHEFNKSWLLACQRVLTLNGTIWVSGTSHIIHSVGYAMQQLGYKILNDIIWYKRNAPPNLSCRYFTHSTETVLWAAKSKKSKHAFNYNLMKQINNGKQMRNVWEMSAPPREEKIYGKHPTQKPLTLLDRIVKASTRKNDLVLDPFQGSGSTGLAALKLGRKYIGIEKEKEYMDLSIKRFRDELSNPSLIFAR